MKEIKENNNLYIVWKLIDFPESINLKITFINKYNIIII